MKRKGVMAQAFEKAQSHQEKDSDDEKKIPKAADSANTQPATESKEPDWLDGVKTTEKLIRNQARVTQNNRDRRRLRLHRRRPLGDVVRSKVDARKKDPLKADRSNKHPATKRRTSKKRLLHKKAKPYQWKPAPFIGDEALEAAYGGIKSARQKKTKDEPRIEKPRCTIPQPFERAPLFASIGEADNQPLQIGNANEWESASRHTDSDMEIVIGLDFGTSSTKVVLQDLAKRSYAVPFTNSVQNPYLLPSRVYEQSEVFMLDKGGVVYRDIKIQLMKKKVAPSVMVSAVAYLSLVIRHCRGWLWQSHKDIYINDSITWGVNLGLPAASYERDWLVERFFVLAMAAMELADSDCERVTAEIADRQIKWAQAEVKRIKQLGGEFVQAITDEYFVGVFPEIAAQIYGFVQSERWDSKDKPMMMMVDVGAGTVDASIFTVTKTDKGQNRFNFLGNNVESNGVMNLHRERLHWLESIIRENGQWTNELETYFRDIDVPTDRLQPIPEDWRQYLPGMVAKTAKNADIDSEFYNKRYWAQLYLETITQVKKAKDPESSQWKALPFFLCGGGRELPLYNQFIAKLSSRSGRSTGVEKVELSKPKDMEAKGLKEGEYHRLSVAYGLSFEDVGVCVKSSEIPDMSVSTKNWQDRYISHDIAD